MPVGLLWHGPWAIPEWNHWRHVVIAYGGRSLTKQERNYSTTEQEASAVVAGIK